MHDVTTIALREALFLFVIGVIGLGPAAFLPETFSRSARLCFAPVLGLSVGVCVFTTVEWYIDGNAARWFIPPLMAVSLAVGYWKHRNTTRQPTNVTQAPARRSKGFVAALQILLVCIAVSVPTAWLLASQHSVGPTAYEVYDAPGYVATADGAQIMSIGVADHTAPPVATFVLEHWINQVETNNRLDFTPLAAATNALTGLHATETWAAYLLAILAAGGLALFGAISVAAGRSTWCGVIAGSLFGGAFFLQLLIDGSQAAIAGLALIVPLLLLVHENIRKPNLPTMLLTALVLAGLMTVYPIFFLPIAATAAIYLAVVVGQRVQWVLRKYVEEAIRVIGYAVAVIAVASIFDVLATIRNVPSWISIIEGSGGTASQPQYNLGVGVVASWLLQIRDFYTTAFGPQSPFFDVIPALLIPIGLFIAVVLGIRKTRMAWIPLVFVVVCAISATKQVAVDSCAYCEDRTLLPVVPALLFIVGASLATIVASASMRRRLIALAGSAAYLGFAGLSLSNEQNRFSTNGIFMADAVRAAISAIPPNNQPVQLEGFSSVPFPNVMAEEALPYEAMLESSPSGVSFFSDEPGQGTANALGAAVALVGNSFYPNYNYVLTRLPQVATGRTVLWRGNGIALEQRRTPLDVTIKGGLNAPTNPTENGGVGGWVNGPLTFEVTGRRQPKEHLDVSFILPSPDTHIARVPSIQLQRNGVYVTICTAITGPSPIQTVTISSIPINIGVVLRSMSASYGSCPTK